MKSLFRDRKVRWAWATLVLLIAASQATAEDSLLVKHCSLCHSGDDAEGEFQLAALGKSPNRDNLQRWLDSLDRVAAGEMPPKDEVQLASVDRKKLVLFIRKQLDAFRETSTSSAKNKTRRLNNREFENSVRDVLMIEDVGTHQPTANLIGDSLHKGFDTHGETLGFSKFHLEQYIAAVRKIVDATILSGEQPKPRRYEIDSTEIISAHTSQNTTRPERKGKRDGFDFLDPRRLAYFQGFKTAPHTGRYRITIRCTGKDRGYYDSRKTGVYDDDPIRLRVSLGDRDQTFELPDEEITELELNEWIAAGSRLRLQHPTDGLSLRGNGNFKFQNAITGEHLKDHDPKLYAHVVANIKTKPRRRQRVPASWHHWVNHWRGPRPVVFSAVVEGPFYESWPPKRQVDLIGKNPKAQNAATILEPIAERAWRRSVRPGELHRIVTLVESKAEQLGDIEALKEGIVSILVSPQFLLLNRGNSTSQERFAEKFSYFLESTIPDAQLRRSIADGRLDSFAGVREEVKRRFHQANKTDSFTKAFPYAWLKLNDINFMAPDPDRFRHYHRKRVSEDMIGEALQFFRHAIDHNVPITEFLSADYSFVNADLATVYQLDDVPDDSTFRKYTFEDGRRGGLLGMGAFLTVTADSLSTSPIHRAIYLMENFLGIHPTPPPPDVQIEEPDVREAKTIKEILNRHRSDPNCASCHQRIDPYGYAFENFDPSGAWRDVYTIKDSEADGKTKNKRQEVKIRIDASAKFRNGMQYKNIVEYRKFLLTDANRNRFVRCFVTKLLTYANGVEPDKVDFAEVDRIVARSAENDYRIIDTIAAVIDSPLFRDQ
ncbi:MAG: hypothetical protein CMJ78_13240 [Planctomycetaceae bacterium]|nr:hypothetical protein [Planctomycetaceae bacterium]